MADHVNGDNAGPGNGDNNDDGQLPDELSPVFSDDALLDALGGMDTEAGGADTGEVDPRELDADAQELNELLLAWRRDIDSEPIGELVDTDTAVEAIHTAQEARRRGNRGHKRRTLVPVAVAAAVLAIAFTGSGLAARGAEPGDALWGLTQVLYTEHAQSVQAAAFARENLEQADVAIAHGRVHKAHEALQSAAQAITKVSPDDHQQELKAEHHKLASKLDDEPSSSAADAVPTTSSAAKSTTSSKATTSADESSSSEPTSTQPSTEDERSSTSQPQTSSSTPSPTSTSSPTPSVTDGTERSGDSETADEGPGIISPKMATSETETPAPPTT